MQKCNARKFLDLVDTGVPVMLAAKRLRGVTPWPKWLAADLKLEQIEDHPQVEIVYWAVFKRKWPPDRSLSEPDY